MKIVPMNLTNDQLQQLREIWTALQRLVEIDQSQTGDESYGSQ
jgi:hypothetical protein